MQSSWRGLAKGKALLYSIPVKTSFILAKFNARGSACRELLFIVLLLASLVTLVKLFTDTEHKFSSASPPFKIKANFASSNWKSDLAFFSFLMAVLWVQMALRAR